MGTVGKAWIRLVVNDLTIGVLMVTFHISAIVTDCRRHDIWGGLVKGVQEFLALFLELLVSLKVFQNEVKQQQKQSGSAER